jgi:hypothetical protein
MSCYLQDRRGGFGEKQNGARKVFGAVLARQEFEK